MLSMSFKTHFHGFTMVLLDISKGLHDKNQIELLHRSIEGMAVSMQSSLRCTQ